MAEMQWTGENIASLAWFLQADVFRGPVGGVVVRPWNGGEELMAALGDWFEKQWDGSFQVRGSPESEPND